jgi:hypothetical protein
MKYDWQKIEQEYVTGNMPLRELEEKYHISKSTIAKHANDAKFVEKRTKYKEKVAKKALTRASTRDARAISRIMTAAERTIRKLSGAITDDTVYGYIVEDPAQKDEETGERLPAGRHVEILTKADTKALVNLSTAIRNLAMATKVMYPDGDGMQQNDERQVVIMPGREEEDEE